VLEQDAAFGEVLDQVLVGLLEELSADQRYVGVEVAAASTGFTTGRLYARPTARSSAPNAGDW